MLSGRLVRWQPTNRLREQVDSFFDDAFGSIFSDWAPFRGLPGITTGGFPALDVWEDEEKFYAQAEVPGMKMDDIEILVNGNELTLRGQRETVEERENVTYHRRERRVGRFSGVVRLPAEVDADRVEAKLERGVLTVTLPKAASELPRKIKVKELS